MKCRFRWRRWFILYRNPSFGALSTKKTVFHCRRGKPTFPGKVNLAELALDVFNSACELLFADQGNDVCDTQSA